MDIQTALAHATARLTKESPSPRLDAEILLAFVVNKPRTYLFTYPEKQLKDKQQEHYEQLILRRLTGEPVAYLVGTREFWSLPLKVNPSTLIPRPETERLVELALELLNENEASILELGTGTGAISLALAREKPLWHILATDISQDALKVAQFNVEQLTIQNLQLVHSNWFQSISPTFKFHAILSNPPYIVENDPHLTQGDVRFEPRTALVSGKSGLDDIRLIIQSSMNYLLPGGLILLEHGYDQKEAVLNLLYQYGYQHTHCWQDWQGNDRISGGWKSNP